MDADHTAPPVRTAVASHEMEAGLPVKRILDLQSPLHGVQGFAPPGVLGQCLDRPTGRAGVHDPATCPSTQGALSDGDALG